MFYDVASELLRRDAGQIVGYELENHQVSSEESVLEDIFGWPDAQRLLDLRSPSENVPQESNTLNVNVHQRMRTT
jgi:hypothetical protein